MVFLHCRELAPYTNEKATAPLQKASTTLSGRYRFMVHWVVATAALSAAGALFFLSHHCFFVTVLSL